MSTFSKEVPSRWKDDYAAQRSQAIIFDIIDSENVESRRIAEAARRGDLDAVRQLAGAQSPLGKLNDILKIANLNFQVAASEGGRLVAVRDGCDNYSIAELSDGERNALLISANVLTAPAETLILLDEPERHLHRSIVSPLLSTLLTYRPDCAFVVSTHDVYLPLDQAQASALLVRSYSHTPRQHWLADRIEAVQDMDEHAATAVLGSRRKMLFIEGRSTSLDIQLYQLVFPDVSIHAVGSCVEVERIVRGLRAANGAHWISAFGIIDRDQRTAEECAQLLGHGVAALAQYSVESIYYHPRVIDLILTRVSETHGINAANARAQYIDGVLVAVNDHKARLAARLAEKAIRDKALRDAPSWADILQGDIEISISSADILNVENQRIDQLIRDRNLEEITARYPIRETPALTAISQALGFRSPSMYEQAVRKALIDLEEARTLVRAIIDPLSDLLQGHR